MAPVEAPPTLTSHDPATRSELESSRLEEQADPPAGSESEGHVRSTQEGIPSARQRVSDSATEGDGDSLTATIHPTKQRLLSAGLPMLLQYGYNDLGIQALLASTHVPKGSFYHHFQDKEDFALQVLDQYMREVHAGLDVCLNDAERPPLERVRCFFERVQENYREQGYMGCLMGGLGQELSGVNEVFRRKVEECFSAIAERIALCLEAARQNGELPAESDPRQMANLLVDCWEGAALRSRLQRDATPLTVMLDFYFNSAVAR